MHFSTWTLDNVCQRYRM